MFRKLALERNQDRSAKVTAALTTVSEMTLCGVKRFLAASERLHRVGQPGGRDENEVVLASLARKDLDRERLGTRIGNTRNT